MGSWGREPMSKSDLVRIQADTSNTPVEEFPHYEILYWYSAGGSGPAQGAAYLWFAPDSESLLEIDDIRDAIIQLLAATSTGGPRAMALPPIRRSSMTELKPAARW